MDAIPASKPDTTPVNDDPAPGPEQRPQPATSSITNVAAMAHVSIATVSRVLSGKRTKDDDIARRVRAAAEELNYSVNYAASSLRGAATNTIGLVIPSATDHFSAGLLDELEPVIDMERQQLLLGIGNEQHTQDERIESLVARKVDGIIIVPAAGVDLAHTLDRTTMTTPIVQVGGRQRSFRTSMVGIDENAAMESIVAHLAEQGVRSAAYLAGKEVSFESAEMFAMFHTQMRTHRLVTDTSWNRFGDSTVERGYQCVWRMFADSDARPPEAVICADDMIALGAMIALQTLGIRVPDDVRVVGYRRPPACLDDDADADLGPPAVPPDRHRGAAPDRAGARSGGAHLAAAPIDCPGLHRRAFLTRCRHSLPGINVQNSASNTSIGLPLPSNRFLATAMASNRSTTS